MSFALDRALSTVLMSFALDLALSTVLHVCLFSFMFVCLYFWFRWLSRAQKPAQ
jgi:hypothetical protein